uniref:BTB domain-containing protein n=1 Tax=Rhabditophanes sp. KR3021 TaxID=114890 RepID=A0AC35TNH8_9BILA
MNLPFLYKLRDQNTFNNFVFVVGGKKFNVNKFVVANSCKYLCNLLNEWGDRGILELDLVAADDFELFLKVIHGTPDIAIDNEEFERLIKIYGLFDSMNDKDYNDRDSIGDKLSLLFFYIRRTETDKISSFAAYISNKIIRECLKTEILYKFDINDILKGLGQPYLSAQPKTALFKLYKKWVSINFEKNKASWLPLIKGLNLETISMNSLHKLIKKETYAPDVDKYLLNLYMKRMEKGEIYKMPRIRYANQQTFLNLEDDNFTFDDDHFIVDATGFTDV